MREENSVLLSTKCLFINTYILIWFEMLHQLRCLISILISNKNAFIAHNNNILYLYIVYNNIILCWYYLLLRWVFWATVDLVRCWDWALLAACFGVACDWQILKVAGVAVPLTAHLWNVAIENQSRVAFACGTCWTATRGRDETSSFSSCFRLGNLSNNYF